MSKYTHKSKAKGRKNFENEADDCFDGDFGTLCKGRKPHKPKRGQSEKYTSAYYN